MTQIKIIFLFAPSNSFDQDTLDRVQEIVTDEYCRQFGCGKDTLEVTICDGKSSSGAYDLALGIASQEKRLNEGVIRSAVKKEVANRLLMLFPRSSGFKGRITTMDSVYEARPAKNASGQAQSGGDEDDPGEYKKRAAAYQAVEPVYSYDMLFIPDKTRNAIDLAVARIQLEREVFEDWGVYAIMPNPISAMSFFGPPGTGKTMAADAVAKKLGKKIIHASYADIESKYHGEGPKNVSAIFLAAEQQDAVLFIDEADSLLSKRLTNVTQGSEQAINSMRSQLLICLESFHGIVIFATNLVVNYDRAFLSRLINIEFPFPDAEARANIWKNHLYPVKGAQVQLKIPLAEDVDVAELGREYDLCGREIRNAVVSACVATRLQGLNQVTQSALRQAAQDETDRRQDAQNAEDHTRLKESPNKAILARTMEKAAQNAPEVRVEDVPD